MSPRKYDSRLRDESARTTRTQVVAAARELFLAEGYAGTTVRKIAAAAGVSEQTVYTRIGNKAAILKAVYDVMLAGDDEPVPMADRPEFRRMRDAPDARSLLSSYAEVATRMDARLRPVLELVYGARAVEPDLDLLASTMAAERRTGTLMFARNFVARGFARPGLGVDDVVDIVWVLNSPEVYLLQVRDNRLGDAEFQRWLAATLQTCLVAPAGPRS
ncbi:MAG TPA: helix-turn-helix domain-containing protein [Pseudonocardia sp.]|nr:helix-turn-helix domain-containing protein [Pseudonocardia sp.]